MLKDKNSYNYQNRNLSEVFQELQEIKNSPTLQMFYKKHSYPLKSNKKQKLFHLPSDYKIIHINLSHVIIVCIILFIFTSLLNKNIFAKSDVPKYELNTNTLNIQNIISKNANINKFKEQTIEYCYVVFNTIYTNNPTLPKGEEVITQQGILGKDKVTTVRTYENQNMIDEVVLSRETILKPTPQLVDVGTSEFLAKHKIHIGDTLYLLEDSTLKESAKSKATDVVNVKKNIDVKLLSLPSEEWCKVSYDNVEGYIKTSNLTSAFSTPDIVEKNRILRIRLGVNIDMELNKSSNLTQDDFKKILTGLSQDKNKILEDNYEVFYNMDQKYNMNGVFLASIAIHESNWGTSKIANDKKNLFGYGAYDSNPYEYSYQFSDYSDGIETVAKALVKYYLNPAGTKIYDDEIAEGTYYNEPTVKGVNVRYATDKEWHTKVFKYMELLYDRLSDGESK